MITKEQVAEARAKYPEAKHYVVGKDEVVVRPPNRSEWRRFKRALTDDSKKADAAEQLLSDCCVLPSKDELAAMLERRPGLAEIFGGKVMLLAVGEEGAQEKNAE